MRHFRFTFLLCGIVAGLISVGLGTKSLEFLATGVGLLFFSAVMVSTIATVSWRYLRTRALKFFAGLVLSTVTYVAGVVAFNMMGGISQTWFGVRSANIVDFNIDIWVGVLAAGIVGALGVASVSAIVTRQWSNDLLLRLLLTGLIVVGLTFIVNLRFHSYWSFFGVLMPTGNALFCWLVGTQIHGRISRDTGAMNTHTHWINLRG